MEALRQVAKKQGLSVSAYVRETVFRRVADDLLVALEDQFP